MENSSEYEQARERATAKYGFFVHAIVYGAVMLLLMGINLFTSPGYLWFVWPLLGWGLAVALHGARVFLISDRNTIIDAMTDEELRRFGTGKHDTHP